MTPRDLTRWLTALIVALVACLPAVPQTPRINPLPLTEADLQKMPAAQVRELFKKVKLPGDDPDPDQGNRAVKGAPSTGEIEHRGMDPGPCLQCTVDLPDPKKQKGDEAGRNVILRALVVKLPHDLTVCYDLDTLAVAAVWQGGFLDLANTNYENSKGGMAPQVPWMVWFTNLNTPGWAALNQKFDDPRPGRLGPLPANWLRYRGHYLHGQRVILQYEVLGREVLEMPGAQMHGTTAVLTRTFHIGPGQTPIAFQTPPGDEGDSLLAFGISTSLVEPSRKADRRFVVPARKDPLIFDTWWAVTAKSAQKAMSESMAKMPSLVDPESFCRGGPKRHGQPLTTQGVVAKEDGKLPYVVDLLTLPFDNPFKSWMRTSAHDFFSDGRMAVATLCGDIWIVAGIDRGLQNLEWTRFATGLYEPLGLKIVKDDVYVLGRDRITRLHDLNGDGEADFYESFWADGNVAPSFHAFSFDLQTDRAGNFYFVKSGRRVEPFRPGHGALIKVSPDGKKSEVMATGFRHPNGMGIGPDDEIVVSDNQGEWVPASKVSLIKRGGFYGYARKDEPAPKAYEPPLFWLPMNVDNSSGGQCWALSDKWGPLNGYLLHTSYGACSLSYAMTQKVGEARNAAVVTLPFLFRSGAMRARVNPRDGQVYVVGLSGWGTKATDVGCIERVRYTGAKAALVTGVEFTAGKIRMHFSEPLDPTTARDPKNYKLEQWNYIWSHFYGSPHMSPSEPTKEGQDVLSVERIELSGADKTVELLTPALQPVHQLRMRLDLRSADGAAFKQTVYGTVQVVK
jgi:hypothetical protein